MRIKSIEDGLKNKIVSLVEIVGVILFLLILIPLALVAVTVVVSLYVLDTIQELRGYPNHSIPSEKEVIENLKNSMVLMYGGKRGDI